MVGDWRQSKRRIGFVPTMGALHEGHLALVRASLEECNRTVVSIFVNPLQFDRATDLETYPREEEKDRALLADAGVQVLFMPRAEDFYPPGFATRVSQPELSRHLCGATRPGHFDGVLTVVLKLFNAVLPDRAYFGQKDYQQVTLIERMVRDLGLPVEIRRQPTVREPDGLAMSSRNKLLRPEDRVEAPRIHAALQDAEAAFRAGNREGLPGRVESALKSIPGARIDYVELASGDVLSPREGPARAGDVLAVALFLGPVRLIDNLVLGDA
ncbi:MAG: pantoate--beta-alanine ligase [Planctomycetes bacterium]|nr:pantoate--beta-alanine ligase [Planctomycetota bacterium]